MKILLVNTYYYPEIYGGAEYSVKKLAEELKQQGHTVKVLCTGSEAKREVIDGIDVIRVVSKNLCRGCEAAKYPLYKRVIRRTLDIWNPFNKAEIDKVLEEYKPDVIHTNGLYDLSTIVWEAAYKKKIKIVHTLRDYHLLCPFTSLHCSKVEDECPYVPPKGFCRMHRAINRVKAKYVDVVTAPSSVTLNLLIKNQFFTSSEKKVVPNATEFDASEINKLLARRKNAEAHTLKFVYLGTLSKQKGIQWMISSFNDLSQNAELYIAGKGKLRDYVEEQAKNNKKIHFVGFLNETQVDELLKECDVLLCPSQWQEPFGRVVLDAYKHAMPVICSDQGALPSLVDDGKTGFVIESGNQPALTAAMQHYIEAVDDICKHAAMGVEKLNLYSLENQARAFCEIYE